MPELPEVETTLRGLERPLHGRTIVRTVVRNPKDELKTGTFHAMLKQLGINEQDLYEQERK